MYIIDRRLNPKGKNIGNRQRFIRRARAEISKVVQEASSRRNVADIGQGDRVVIPSHGLKEPLFRKAHSGGTRSHVLPGNKEYVPGDKLPRPPEGGGRGGREGSPDGGGDDEFQFVLSRQEFVDLFLEDLELPELVKKQVKHTELDRTHPRRLHRFRLALEPQHPAHDAQQPLAADRARTALALMKSRHCGKRSNVFARKRPAANGCRRPRTSWTCCFAAAS